MTHDIRTELTDEEVAQAVGGGIGASTGTLTLTGSIGDPVASDLSKLGTGQLILPAANTYTGTTQVQQGSIIAI
jgi:autotransporter-associated beta strand protein